MQSTLEHWTLAAVESQHGFTPPYDMREAITKIQALPPLPGTAARIVNLISNPDADVEELVDVIEQDPLLAAQIIRWASSPLYGYRGQINSVRNAIVRVLGFNFVLDLALGLAMMESLKAPKDSVVGTRMFWIQALASTRLMPRLAAKMPVALGFKTEEIFMAGLLHNIGFPLFGHLFAKEFGMLRQLINANPTLSVYNLENFVFGVNHAQLGAWLMKAWAMPDMIADIIYHHHNPFYRGDHDALNLLVYINDYLLGQIGIGDGANQSCSDDIWAILQLQPSVGFELLDGLQSEIDAITEMAESLIR